MVLKINNESKRNLNKLYRIFGDMSNESMLEQMSLFLAFMRGYDRSTQLFADRVNNYMTIIDNLHVDPKGDCNERG